MSESKDMLVIEVIAGIGKIERGIGTMAMEYWTDKDTAPLNKGVALLRGLDLENARLRAELDEALGALKKCRDVIHRFDIFGSIGERAMKESVAAADAILSKHSKEGQEVTDNKG